MNSETLEKPITANKQALCNALYAFISQRSGRICTIEDWAGDAAKESDANAQFIVHAVNCHDALLEACKVASEMFDDSMFVWGSDDEAKVSKMLKQLRAAITRATTQKEGAK